MSRPGRGKPGNRATVIKRVAPPAEHGHHGGAWKIAYADFVTAMMAFFLLMWLVNATTEAQRRGISDYFAPTHIAARSTSGSGQPFGGRSLEQDSAIMAGAPMLPMPIARTAEPPVEAEDPDQEPEEDAAARHAAPTPASAAASASAAPDPARAAADAARREAIARAAAEVREALRDDGALSELARQVLVEEVPEGLRVQLVDAEGQPVFATGQAAPNDRGRALLLRVATVLARLPNPIEITGHTDATPFRGGAGRTNWDLSSERANATRRLLLEGGIAEARIRSVSGRADRDPLLPTQPLDATNRRVAVLMLMPPAERPAP